MVNRAQEHFDRLRHQLYLQYGLRHIEAGGKKFSWTRFDDLDEKRIPIQPGTVLEEPTVCFVDETVNVTFGRSLRETVLMIVLPEGRTDEIIKFVRQYYPAGTVERVAFWFGRRYIMDRREFYRDLVADMCHHFATHFGRLEQYVVLPPYMLDYDPTWTMGPLAVFAQRKDVAPHARVVLDELDLHLWLGNAVGVERPLPDSIDATGRLLTPQAIMERKCTLTVDHDLDLWRNTEELEREPLPGYTMGQQNLPAEKGAPAPLAASPTSPAATKRVPAPLAYSPVATPRPKSPPATSGDDFFKNNPGCEKIAEYTARRINDKVITNLVAKLSTVEKAVTTAETANAEMDDSDALSEPTPNKDRESQQ
ncbi:hypothetical protein AAVH_41565 [Aphelenchoides avenae]|nr:hypothetical protein AAVH_41565 [Aphelenchus avenae]